MKKMSKKKQKSGDESINVQAEQITIHHGVTYNDAKEIALNVFNSNFSKLAGIAKKIAQTRAEEITEKFLRKLEKENEAGLQSAKDPDFQYSLFTVQKEYAKYGDKELGDLLVDILVDRTKEKNRSILQIVLNESLQIAPKLTNNQLSVLSIIFVLKYTINYGLIDHNKLFNYLDSYIAPFIDHLTKKQACYQHLVYTGCGSISIGSNRIEELFKRKYKGLFSNGFSKEILEKEDLISKKYRKLIMRSLKNPELLQINALNDETLKEECSKLNLSEAEINKLIRIQNEFLFKIDDITNFLIEHRSYMQKLFDIWNDSYMKNMSLTSVGIAIGHANVKRKLGEFTDLSIWIN